MTRLRSISSDERGVAMIVAMGTLTMLLLLTATVLSATSLLGQATNQDTLRKRAFEAAEAGLQATIYRLNMIAPAQAKCIGGPDSSVQSPAGGACPPYTESLGNGASYTAWTTATLSNGGSCGGVAVGSSATVQERCVTAAGTVDGVTRRVQTRVASYEAAPIFPLPGVVGLSGVTIEENARVVGGTGSNGTVKVDNNAATSNVALGPSAPDPVIGLNGITGPIGRRSVTQGPFALAPVDPGNSATVNDDARLTNGFANPRISPFDAISGNVTWDPATRTLDLGNNASVTIGGGLYNFCRLTLANNAKVTLATGARTAIYIDSPERAGSGCPAGTGTFSMSNNSAFVNNAPPVPGSGFAADPTALQLYVVGRTGASVRLSNNTAFYGTVYAPTSTLEIANNAGTWGAMSANIVKIKQNAVVTGDPNATAINASGGGVYFRTAWRECLATAPTADPGSGC